MFRKILKILGVIIALFVVVVGVIVLVGLFRPNQAEVNPELEMDVWPAVADGEHNSNTDLIYWQDQFYLVHARSPFHMGTAESKLVVLRSPDAETWTEVADLNVEGEDIRDPKFAEINGQLLLYALINNSLEPEPYGTVVSTTSNGETWSAFEDVDQSGWLLWRPKTQDGETWYVTAYWHEHGRSKLFKSTDGINWEEVSLIHEGDRNDETAFEFLPDGRMLVTGRLEGTRSWHQGAFDAGTLLAVAEPPYTEWTETTSDLTRLDGPALFPYNGRVYAVARYDPQGFEHWYGMSSILSKKRTALYEVRADELIYLSDLPSAGDTSYPGVVLQNGDLVTSYYTNDTGRDYPWLLGLVMPSDIMMARVPLDQMEALADHQVD